MQYRAALLILIAASLSACETARGTREPVWPYPNPPRAPGTTPSAPPSQPAPTGQGQQPSGPVAQPAPSLPPLIPSIPGEPLPAPVNIPEMPQPLPDYPQTADRVSGGAVLSLLKQARSALDMGKPEQAQSALDRAVRIEPRNYFVWSTMARAYLEQRNYAQAVTTAQKSNSLARGNIYVELENYRVIAAARDATGDAAGSVQAQARVDEIQRMLQAAQQP